MDYAEIFGPDGPLARTLPGFATRAEQIAMAEQVDCVLRTNGKLIVEAGTGTGKTFAYLAPALHSGRRVIVSTGTRTLQDQLFIAICRRSRKRSVDPFASRFSKDARTTCAFID
jgi:Rad3-related DNA helicases